MEEKHFGSFICTMQRPMYGIYATPCSSVAWHPHTSKQGLKTLNELGLYTVCLGDHFNMTRQI
jgi:hypothetical protein